MFVVTFFDEFAVTLVRSFLQKTSLYGMWDDILGQFVFVDPYRRITAAYTTNHAHGRSLKRDFILKDLLGAVYQCLASESNYPHS